MGWQTKGGLTTSEREKLSKIDVGLKSNLNATVPPTATDDNTKGYGVGSTWSYNNITYLCGDSAKDNAVWISTANIYYFNTWTQFVAAVSSVGTEYENKYATVANANGGPSGGTTYTAPNALLSYIDDGGAAVYKINKQGITYSITCQARTITNPIVKQIMVVTEALPTTPGYYIFSVPPIGGLPVGISLNDIAYFDGTKWSLFQLYVKASTVLVAINQTNTTEVTWRKFAGTWMSTADEYIPDGKEYQTGKLYNGKPVYRKCISNTLGANSVEKRLPTLFMPTNGKMVSCMMNVNYNVTKWMTVSYTSDVFIVIDTDGVAVARTTWLSGSPIIAWLEYTKS